jgi:hypothetical protein
MISRNHKRPEGWPRKVVAVRIGSKLHRWSVLDGANSKIEGGTELGYSKAMKAAAAARKEIEARLLDEEKHPRQS